MPILIRLHAPMPTRDCRFCLSLQDDSVFADFEVDDAGQVFLRRISFDGYGCCHVPETSRRMNPEDSRTLLDAVARAAVDDPRIGALLSTYFHEHQDVIWTDALHSHELL